MDLTFQKTTISYLQAAVTQTGIREETTELILPDREPDIGRVIGAWGVPVVRSKELQSGSMSVSGGINAWVLYAPADDGSLRTLRAYLPFSMRWDTPLDEQWEGMCASCRMHSMDARMSGARKLLIRGTVACQADAYSRKEADFYNLPEPPADVEILKQHLPLCLPGELGEKQFSLEEALELPSGMPPISGIVAWQLSPEVTDSRLMGDKAVFKGSLQMHLVYMTPEDRLSVWDHTLPFSQYTELTQHYDQEETALCQPLITEADLSLNAETGELALNCGLCLQCTILREHPVELVADLYSPHRSADLQTAAVPVRTRLDRNQKSIQAEINFPLRGCTILDATVLPNLPRIIRSENHAVLETPVWCSLLYYDDTGKLQGKTGRGNATNEFALASGCLCIPSSCIEGPVHWGTSNADTTVRPNLRVTADCFAQEELTMLCGASLGEKERRSRPSVIIQRPDSNDTLWSLAKAHNSTIDAICKANHLKPGPLKESAMLLIPVV